MHTTLNTQNENKVKKKIRKNSKVNDNEDTIHQHLSEAAHAMLRGKFIDTNAYKEKRKF